MWLSEIKIVTPTRVIERGALHMQGGKITALVEGDAPGEALAAPGLTAMPGVVDLHGDMLEQEVEPRPGAFFPFGLALYELDKRLVAAGITTAYAAISFAWQSNEIRRQETAIKIIESLGEQRPCLMADLRTHARFEITNPETVPILTDLIERELVHLVSLMDHTPGQGQYKDIERYIRFMQKWIVGDNEMLERLIDDEVIEALKAGMLAKEAEARNWELARDLCNLAVANGLPVASHDDDTPEKVAKMADLGVTISEFPVSLAAAEAARAHGMHILMGAPNAYRDKSTSGNLTAMAALRAGLLDSLGTDYVPAAPLQAAFRVADVGALPLHEAVNLVTRNPADTVGLTDRGRLEVGAAADIVLVAEDNDHPRVHATFCAGEPVFWDVFIERLTQGSVVDLMESDS